MFNACAGDRVACGDDGQRERDFAVLSRAGGRGGGRGGPRGAVPAGAERFRLRRLRAQALRRSRRQLDHCLVRQVPEVLVRDILTCLTWLVFYVVCVCLSVLVFSFFCAAFYRFFYIPVHLKSNNLSLVVFIFFQDKGLRPLRSAILIDPCT